MCLAVPGKVVAIDRNSSPRMGTVSFSGVQKQICLEWVPEVKEGEYVVVHVGFALNTLDEGEALETLRLLQEMESLEIRESDGSERDEEEPEERKSDERGGPVAGSGGKADAGEDGAGKTGGDPEASPRGE